MKILVFSRETVFKSLKGALFNSDIELYSLPFEKLNKPDKTSDYDLAIIDMALKKAENVCSIIHNKFKIPIVLITRSMQTDWSYLDSLNASGYITDSFNKNELIGRLTAISRRYRAKQKVLLKQEAS